MNKEAIEMPNPHKSENMWAASVIIDKEFARYPPITSAIMNRMQTVDTQMSFFMACFVVRSVSFTSFVKSLFL
jgi:hypothetical protein